MIKADHRLLEDLFAALRSGQGDRRALVDEVAARLTAHSSAEEEHVYPAIAAADPGEGPAVGHAQREHDEAVHLLRKVANLIDSPHYAQAVDEFVAAVAHHVAEEETEILPALTRAVDADALGRLGEAFERARRERLDAAGFDPAGADTKGADTKGADTKGADRKGADTNGRGGTRGQGNGHTPRGTKASSRDLAAASRDELYELAKQAGIPGRSSMTKTELARALRGGSD
jgi:hemerythrin superfamily protein